MKKILEIFKKMDIKAFKIMKYGLMFCFSVCIVSILILFTYEVLNASPVLYYIGLSTFRLSTIFAIEFIICALVADYLKKSLA